MGFKNISSSNSKRVSKGTASSNHGNNQIPNEVSDRKPSGVQRNVNRYTLNSTTQTTEARSSSSILYRKGLSEKSVRRELFLLEYEDAFEELSLKEKNDKSD
jgi:hypothetical protein